MFKAKEIVIPKPEVPAPVYTADMDEETREVTKRRYEEDKMTAEQRWVMQRKKKEIEEEQRVETARREYDDKTTAAEYERQVAELQARLRQVDATEAQENEIRARRHSEFKAREEEKRKAAAVARTKATAEADRKEDEARAQTRARELEDRKKRLEKWKLDEEERMRRELAAKIKAEEEKERLEVEALRRKREAEDVEIAKGRKKRDADEAAAAENESKKRVNDYETSMLQDAKVCAESHAKERANIKAAQTEANDKRRRFVEERDAERSRKDLATADALAKVSREIEDLDRKEQREKVKRVEEDIERVERKEQERREREDQRRRQELEKIRQRQLELENAEREDRERREREDREREERRQRLLNQAAQPPAAAKPLPSPAAAQDASQHPQTPPKPAAATPSPATPPPQTHKPLPAAPKQLPVPPAHKPLPTAPKPAQPQGSSGSAPAAAAAGGFDPNVISEQQRAQYAGLFAKADHDKDGFLNGQEGRDFFRKSGLPNDKLGKIWRLSDFDGDNKLNLVEFSVAIHIVYAFLKGNEIPSSVSPSLKASAQPQIL